MEDKAAYRTAVEVSNGATLMLTFQEEQSELTSPSSLTRRWTCQARVNGYGSGLFGPLLRSPDFTASDEVFMHGFPAIDSTEDHSVLLSTRSIASWEPPTVQTTSSKNLQVGPCGFAAGLNTEFFFQSQRIPDDLDQERPGPFPSPPAFVLHCSGDKPCQTSATIAPLSTGFFLVGRGEVSDRAVRVEHNSVTSRNRFIVSLE